VFNIQKQRNQKANIPLAQAEGPRLGERFLSLKRAPFA